MRSSQNNENHYTPEELCKTLVQLVDISPDDILLEPFMGDGAFYNHFPEENIKDWCEITKGRDFLEYEGVCDIIITNPPYADCGLGCMDWVFKCFECASKTVGILLSIKVFNSFTPLRLQKIQEKGWNITKIHICNVKKWYGRYYFIIFEQDKPSIITYDTKSY